MNVNQVLATIDNFLKVTNNSNGRDKLTKILQYSTRIVDDALSSQQNPNLDAIKRVQLFGTGLATARKVMRFWKPLVGYLALIRFIQRLVRLSHGNGKEKELKLIELFQLIEKVFVSNYFLFDHLNWASKLGLLSNQQPVKENSYELTSLLNNSRGARYGTIGFTFWMYGALAGLIATTMELVENVNRESALVAEMHANVKQQQQKQPTVSSSTTSNLDLGDDNNKRAKELELQMVKLTHERNALIRKEIVGLCDFGTAANLSGHWQTKNWFVGLLGVVSAGIGVYELWP